jgi:UDP-N-acetylmuramoyl-L-alanyl-D-glutamate--2,6-diaminopimelate ligase
MWRKAKNKYHLLQSFAANVYYGFPAKKLTVIGVTGTSGKTTTTMMLYHILKTAGYKVSVLSTVKAVIGKKEYDTGFHVTTPDPWVLPKYIKKAVADGDSHFVLEVSSHALDQNRAAFVPFSIGVLTSFAHEHLDYHKTLANYARAKFKLLHAAKLAILPIHVLNERLQKAVQFDRLQGKMRTFGLQTGDETQKDWELVIPQPGDVTILDGLAAATAATALGVDKAVIKKALASFPGVPGRFELIPNSRGLHIIIDFAHKPDALEGVLRAAQKMVGKKGRILVMYGAASERDTLKRPIMGKISGKIADVTVLTDEDPRNEDSMKILDEIGAGCVEAGAIEWKMENGKWKMENQTHVFVKIPDRQEAINFIINKLAAKDDIILFCGKGHELSMNYHGKELPWSEHAAVKKALGSIIN